MTATQKTRLLTNLTLVVHGLDKKQVSRRSMSCFFFTDFCLLSKHLHK